MPSRLPPSISFVLKSLCTLVDYIFGHALEFVWVELHNVFIFNMIRLIDKLRDHIVLMLAFDDTEQLNLLVADVSLAMTT